jgi:hypothetical protein
MGWIKRLLGIRGPSPSTVPAASLAADMRSGSSSSADGGVGPSEVVDEVAVLRRILSESLHAKRFLQLARSVGFQCVEEGPLGVRLESTQGHIMFAVFPFTDPGIGVLVYSPKDRAGSVTLVNDGHLSPATNNINGHCPASTISSH